MQSPTPFGCVVQVGSGPYNPSLNYGMRTYEAVLPNITLGTTAFERGYSSGGSEPVADILDVILERLGSPSS